MKKIYTQVLILGGGAAGISTALKLNVFRVALVELPESSTASSVWNIGLGQKDEFKAKIRRVGHYMGNKSLIAKFVSLHRQTISDLKKFGIAFRRSNIGQIPDKMSGQQIYRVLRQQLNETKVRKIKGEVSSFLKDQNSGALVGVAVQTAQGPIEIYFNYAVIAGGGITRFYNYTTNPNNTNGSLLALAGAVGLELQNIEFSMFHPFLITDKRFSPVLFSGTFLTKMRFEDDSGREFLSPEIVQALRRNEHHSVFPQMTREFYLQSLKGKIWAVPECSEDWFEDYKHRNEYGFIFKSFKLKELGRLEIHPAFHFLIGGIAINERAETSEKNIYAAGEICGGLYGANRFGGTAVSEAWVFGKVAAGEINKKLKKTDFNKNEFKDLKVVKVGRLGLRRQIKERVWEALGPVRDARSLRSFIDLIDQQGNLSSEEKLIRLMAEVSLKREASVGGFFRRDLPVVDKAYNSYCQGGTISFRS